MKISLLTYAKADLKTATSLLLEVKNGQGNVKALKGIVAYHIQQTIEKAIKHQIYKVNPNINPRIMYTQKFMTYVL